MEIAEGLACVVENLGRVDNIAGVCVVNVVIASPAIAVRVNGIVFSVLRRQEIKRAALIVVELILYV